MLLLNKNDLVTRKQLSRYSRKSCRYLQLQGNSKDYEICSRHIKKLTVPSKPPAKRARFPTDVATNSLRACDKEAVVHVLDEEL
jgi:hypothetical protein